MKARKISKCRVCFQTSLTMVMSFGYQYLQGLFPKPAVTTPQRQKFPLNLVRCETCGLIQLSHTVSPKILYSLYWYRSGVNETMRQHLKEIAQTGVKMIGKKKALVLDIGCNDGTLLNFYPRKYLRVGVDPSNAILSIKKDIKIIKDIFPSKKLEKWLGMRKFDIITSIAMFYDIDNPVDFVMQIKDVLSNDGLWIFEVYYTPHFLKLGCYDLVCHEHLLYFSVKILKLILQKAGMKFIKIEVNDINGKSIKCFATHAENTSFSKNKSDNSLKKYLLSEKKLNIDSKKTYSDFKNKILKHKKDLTTLLKNLRSNRKRIHLYGASTKGNTILQFCKIDHALIDFAADRNPQKYGAKTPGTNIPIISEKKSRKMKPDYYLVMPWAFKSEFIKREQKTIRSGTRMIFPFPEIEIIEAN